MKAFGWLASPNREFFFERSSKTTIIRLLHNPQSKAKLCRQFPRDSS